MAQVMATTVSRRDWLSRLLMAAAVAPVVGATLADTADASKKGKPKRTSIRNRVASYEKLCAGDGGTVTVSKRPGGTSVTCTGGTQLDGQQGDWTCTVSSKKSRCHALLTTPPRSPLDDFHTPPTDGVNEDPTVGGGNDAGGGADVPPSGGIDPIGGGSGPVLE